jgi:hypothetical protein
MGKQSEAAAAAVALAEVQEYTMGKQLEAAAAVALAEVQGYTMGKQSEAAAAVALAEVQGYTMGKQSEAAAAATAFALAVEVQQQQEGSLEEASEVPDTPKP